MQGPELASRSGCSSSSPSTGTPNRLVSYHVIVDLIAATTAQTGLWRRAARLCPHGVEDQRAAVAFARMSLCDQPVRRARFAISRFLRAFTIARYCVASGQVALPT